MKFVNVEWDDEWRGYSLDTQDYVARIESIKEQLPSGAREFATDLEHYDFYSEKCVKDLRVESFEFDDDDKLSKVNFGPNEWKHNSGLTVSYMNIVSFDVDPKAGAADPRSLGTVLLDEVLPHSAGCSHEVVCTGGRMLIVCSDLEAEWR